MSKPLKVLMVEDSADDAQLIVREVSKGGYDPDVTRVQTAEAMQKALENGKWDIVLSDYRMPGFSGLQALEILKKSGSDIPFILISGKVGEDVAVEAMKAGACDYVMKSHLNRLDVAIERELHEARIRHEGEQAKEALRQSETRFQTLFEQAADIILQLEIIPSGIPVIREANSATFRLLGYERDELIGQPVSFINEAIPDASKVVDKRRQNLLSGTGTVFEARHRCKDGTIRDFECSVTEMQIGSKTFGISLERDITGRKRAEMALQESEARYRAIFNASADGILIANLETKIFKYANPAICRMLGYSEEELRAMEVADIHPKENLQWIVADFEAQARGDKKVSPDIPCLRKDGTIIYADVNASGITIGGWKCSVGFFRDITERKHSEQLEREAIGMRERLAVIDSMADGLMLLTKTGVIISLNKPFETLSGFSQEELRGKAFSDLIRRFVDTGDIDKVMSAFQSYGENSPEVSLQFIMSRNDGRKIPVMVTLALLRDAGGKMTHAVATFKDISLFRQMEAGLRAAKNDAESASRAKSDFLSCMSHELRTPLNSIIGFSQVLEEQYFGQLNEKQQEYIQDILESGQLLLSLINDILDLSKIEAGKMELDLSQVNLKSLLERSIVMFKEKCHAHDINLQLQIPETIDGLEIGADERKLKQVVFNLLSNASKFTPDGGAITLTADLDEKNVTVGVIDTGIGIPSEYHSRIFDEFYQVRGGLTSKTPGTGLGLSLCRSIVKLHGGTIRVESGGEDKGSVFSFTIPLAVPETPEQHVLGGMTVEKCPWFEKSISLEESLESFVNMSTRHNRRFSVCSFHSRSTDLCGHFPRIKEILNAQKRNYDILLIDRVKGRIFVLLIENDLVAASKACDRFREKLKKELGVSINQAIVVFPDDGKDVKKLIDALIRKMEATDE